MHYFPLTNEERQEMLDTIGVENFGQILTPIPAKLKNPALDIPPHLSEIEINRLLGDLAAKNLHCKNRSSFLGAGAYDHFSPSIVNEIISRNEFYTAYTPYQAEASQGTLQAIFEYQSLICELTGMDVSNGSHYDGATALAEAALLSLTKTQRAKILIARSVHPDYRRVVQTYVERPGHQIEEIPFLADGNLDKEFLKKKLTNEVASVIIASPNFLGLVEDLEGLSDQIHQNGSLFILVSNPLSHGFYKTPAELGADISCGEGQPLGIPMSYGGPWLGFFATKRELVRQIPGRLVGLTKDSDGKRAFCLTLQAREQHIRREKAASNICTNQALCALAACVYMAAMGKAGIRQVAELNIENAVYLRREIAKLRGFKILTAGPIFNEFSVICPKPVSDINRELLNQGIIGGYNASKKYDELENTMVICATETKTKEELDRFVKVLGQVAS